MSELKKGHAALRLTIGLGAALMVSACEMGLPGIGKKGADGDAAVATTVPGNSAAALPVGGERDVEAPEVFKKSDKALWDGRPSLGGVWVAHVSVTDPERVIIRNPATGKSVIGALFRREIDNPGPSLQLSSDAAEALGMLAGQPAVIDVVALKRVEAPAPAVPTPAAATAPVKPGDKPAAPPATKGGKPIATKPIEPVVATAAAAIDKAAAKASGAKPAPTPEPVATPATPGDALKRPFVQIGIFSVEANAKKAAAQMQKAGMSASVKADASQGKSFWRVIVGPAATVADREALVGKVKGLGYPDAYPVSK